MDNNNKQEEEPRQQGNHNTTNNNIKRINDLKDDDLNDDNNTYHYNNTEIGKTIISDKHPNTIDSFWFALAPGTIVKPFDFVTVEQSSPSSSSLSAAVTTTPPSLSSYRIKTIGMIQDLQAIVPTDNYYHY